MCTHAIRLIAINNYISVCGQRGVYAGATPKKNYKGEAGSCLQEIRGILIGYEGKY